MDYPEFYEEERNRRLPLLPSVRACFRPLELAGFVFIRADGRGHWLLSPYLGFQVVIDYLGTTIQAWELEDEDGDTVAFMQMLVPGEPGNHAFYVAHFLTHLTKGRKFFRNHGEPYTVDPAVGEMALAPVEAAPSPGASQIIFMGFFNPETQLAQLQPVALAMAEFPEKQRNGLCFDYAAAALVKQLHGSPHAFVVIGFN